MIANMIAGPPTPARSGSPSPHQSTLATRHLLDILDDTMISEFVASLHLPPRGFCP